MRDLGVQMIPAYSPQARGRSERNFSTWQGRLPQELRLREITHPWKQPTAFCATYTSLNSTAASRSRATQRGNAFTACRRRDLELDLLAPVRTYGQPRQHRQLSEPELADRTRSAGARTLAGCHVMVHQHLDGTLSLTHGPPCLGRYTAQGTAIETTSAAARKAVEKPLRWKSHKADFPTSLGNPATVRGIPTFPPPRLRLLSNLNRTYHVLRKADILTCYRQSLP